jgi:hypothetical protein
VLTGVVDYERYGLPDFGVCTRRFEGRYIWSGQQGVVQTTFFAYRDV